MKILKLHDAPEIPWRNGGGLTREIARASTGAEAFLWRLSAATIRQSGPFSSYPGFQRQLAVWKGEGLWLNEIYLPRGQVSVFSGELPVYARISNQAVEDLGVIYDSRLIEAGINPFGRLNDPDLDLRRGLNFLFCVEGDLSFGTVRWIEQQICVFEDPSAEPLLGEGWGFHVFIHKKELE